MENISNIAFKNISTVVTDQQAIAVMNALQIQVSRDFYPIWGIGAQLTFFNRNQNIPPGYWWLIIKDYLDIPNAGYHDLTPDNMPVGYISAKAGLYTGASWTVTASHELLEMLIDPAINLCARREMEDGKSVLYAYEVCDACQEDQYGYLINGVLVSDFVFPEWFEDIDHPPGTSYDMLNLISEPFQILDGCYNSVNKNYSNEGWIQVYGNAENKSYGMRPTLGSRRERRRTPRCEWLRSEAT